MPKFTFNGTEVLYYPSLGVSVNPGDTVELNAAPGDGNWAPASTSKVSSKAAPASEPAPAPASEPAPAPAPSASKDA